ncbi:MAG: GNAT family protein [Flavobacterium sp.]|nr:GNAT family protein [Flavobacterium sp.]
MARYIELKTDRLLLKSVTPNLIDEFFDKKDKSEVLEYFQTDDDGYARLLEMYEGGMETYRISMFYFLVVNLESKVVIGECGFHTWNRLHRRAEIFYFLRNDADKRQGFMSEAVAKVLEYGFNELNIHRVQALVANDNLASIKLVQKFGFTFEGTAREDYFIDGKNEDSQCYSLVKNPLKSYL